MGLEKDNDVGMREASLLKLSGVEPSIDITQHSINDVLDERVQLGFEGTHHQVRAIRSSLARKE
jgi:hypothetical protein